MAATGGSSEPSKLPGRGRDRELVLDRLEYPVTLWIFYRLEYHIYIYHTIIYHIPYDEICYSILYIYYYYYSKYYIYTPYGYLTVCHGIDGP